jgi:hypothetical protein
MSRDAAKQRRVRTPRTILLREERVDGGVFRPEPKTIKNFDKKWDPSGPPLPKELPSCLAASSGAPLLVASSQTSSALTPSKSSSGAPHSEDELPPLGSNERIGDDVPPNAREACAPPFGAPLLVASSHTASALTTSQSSSGAQRSESDVPPLGSNKRPIGDDVPLDPCEARAQPCCGQANGTASPLYIACICLESRGWNLSFLWRVHTG